MNPIAFLEEYRQPAAARTMGVFWSAGTSSKPTAWRQILGSTSLHLVYGLETCSCKRPGCLVFCESMEFMFEAL